MEQDLKKYCPNLYAYERFKTREVKVGMVGIGGDNPIRLQSMTTTDTMDSELTINQSIRMIEAGSELVRITAPSKKDAHNLAVIKEGLLDRGYNTPLVADIHFTPNAAEVAAGIVEKVRVNPGNYADKKKFENHEYTDESYQSELIRIEEKFSPLVIKCKAQGRAMRIGTNHGSLSDRIMSRYGDTPLGMVESAMEFIRICREHDYHELVISMKASNPQVMVQAYRMLVNHMMAEGMNYPLHLGVTEAGEGEDGRIKSAVGIGALLEDGLGDTVRVSLTEEPEAEIPVARILTDRYQNRKAKPIPEIPIAIDPFSYSRRHTNEVANFGGREVPRVVLDLSHLDEIKPGNFFSGGYNYSIPLDKWNIKEMACDYFYVGNNNVSFDIPGTLGIIQNHSVWLSNSSSERTFPLIQAKELFNTIKLHSKLNFILVNIEDIDVTFIEFIRHKPVVLVLESSNDHAMPEMRAAFFKLIHSKCEIPVIIRRTFESSEIDEFLVWSSTDAGSLFVDGLGDGIWLSDINIPLIDINKTSFGILQATRTRISKTEYISCPSCGRTLFDLQETTARIRSRTDHLKGVKIGIMGCIVNGPGEMADADYGYVGTGPGKITLYKEKEVVQRNVPTEQAVDALIQLIKDHGDWREPLEEHQTSTS